MRISTKPHLLFACFLCLFSHPSILAQTNRDHLLDALTLTVDSAQYYDAGKFERIGAIKNRFDASADKTLPIQYNYFLSLYEEYKIFRFDTAFLYAQKLGEVATAIGDPFKVAQSKIKLAFILLSAGMYGETADVMDLVNIKEQPDSLKAEYYLLKGRYYYDLADYDGDDYFYPAYFKKAGEYIDSALQLFSTSSFEHIYYSGLKQMKTGDMVKAFANFQTLVDKYPLSDHELAVAASTLSYVYHTRGLKDSAISYQAKAAMADIRSSTKETFAILNLAQMLFREGDFKRASQYIRKAIDDASLYGARQRKVQVSAIMPIIQSSEINYIEAQRRSWIIYGAIVSFVLIMLVFLAVIIYRQNKKLKQAQKEISSAHARLHEVNHQLQDVNAELQSVNSSLREVNTHLEEANKIKEEYVGYFFTINAGLFQKIEKFKTTLEEKIHYGKFNEVKYVVNGINIKDEKEELLKSFDKAFLKLFPHFVEDFNALFDEENKVKLQNGELLNTDLRIYALLRLGIRENEKIAEILEYSVKSIYAYKTRIRNKSNVPKDEFDKKVMEIKSI